MAVLINEFADALNAKPIESYRAGVVVVAEDAQVSVLLQFRQKDGTLTAYTFSVDLAERMAANLITKAKITRALKQEGG